MTPKEQAEEIIAQLKWKGPFVFMSWGASKFTYGTDLFIPLEDDKRYEQPCRVFIQFHVNGAIHKGYVYVVLTGADDYTIILVKERRKKVFPESKRSPMQIFYEMVSITEGIYCDELADTVDRLVENKIELPIDPTLN